MYHCYTYDWAGSTPIKKGSYSSFSEAKSAADGAGAYSAIVCGNGEGLKHLNAAAWGWGAVDRTIDLCKNPVGAFGQVLLGGKPLASNIQALVDKARSDGNFP